MTKYNKYSRIFFEGDDDNASGAGGFAPIEEGNSGGGEGSGEGSGAPPAPSGLDPKAFAQEFGNVIAEQFKQREKAQPQRAPTPEEIAEARKALKFWEPTDEFVKEFGNLETQKSAFEKLRDGLMAQFVAIQNAVLAQQEEKWNSRFQPVQSLLEQRNQQEQISRFESTYPTLANPKLADLRNAVGQKLMTSGAFNGKSEAEAFEILAKNMAEVIQVTNPEFQLGAKQSGGSASRRSNAITPTAHGSGGGGSGSNGGDDSSGVKLPKAAALFAKVRG